jgi:hypothetical protein
MGKRVNTYVHVRDEQGRAFVLKPGDEVPSGVTVDNPDVFGDLPEVDLGPVPGPGQVVAFDPESDEAKERAGAKAGAEDGLDRMSHAELDDFAAQSEIDMSPLGTGKVSRDDKIELIRGELSARRDADIAAGVQQ